MKELLKKKWNPLLAVLIAYLLSLYLVNDLDLRYIYVYALLGGFLVLNIYTAGFWRPGMRLRESAGKIGKLFTPMKLWFLALVVVTAVFSLLPNASKDHQVISLTISMLIFSCYLFFMEPGQKGIRYAFTVIRVMSLLFALYIVAVKLWPQFYWNYVYPYLGEYVQSQADLLLPMGYGVPMGGSSTYACYVMVIALFVNMAELFIEGGPGSIKRLAVNVGTTVIYILAILLMGRRSEVLALGAAGFVMLVLYFKPEGKQELIRRGTAIIAILLVGVMVAAPFVKHGYMDRHVSVIQAILPDKPEPSAPPATTQTPPTTVQQTTPPTTVQQTTPSTTPPTTVQQTTPSTTPPSKPKPSANQLTSGRLDLWKKAWELFRENTVFGIGWEQFINHNTYEHDVHNTYLQWLCESGIVGFVLLMIPTGAMYILTLWRTIQYRRKRKNGLYGLKEMNFVSLAMQTFLLAVNLIDPAFYHLNYFCFYGFVIALEDTSCRLEKNDAEGDVT